MLYCVVPNHTPSQILLKQLLIVTCIIMLSLDTDWTEIVMPGGFGVDRIRFVQKCVFAFLAPVYCRKLPEEIEYRLNSV